MKWIFSFNIALVMFLLPFSAPAEDTFKVNSLDKPFKLVGEWYFTKEDKQENAAVETVLSSWKVVRAPGNWKKIYDDHENFTIGWYRKTLEFDPDLVGKEVVFLLDTYMAKVNVFLDGKEIYQRKGANNMQRYYSVQPIPILFKVTKTKHVVAFRVDTILMKGVYQLPFELRSYRSDDRALAWYPFWGGEVRVIAAYLSFFAGLFFLLVFLKTHYGLYLNAALACLVITPFFGAPGDYLLKFFEPDSLLLIHYSGLFAIFFHFRFAQYFYKHFPRVNLVIGIPYGLIGLGFLFIAPFFFNLNLFQSIRSLFFMLALLCGIGMFYLYFRGFLLKKKGALIMIMGTSVYLYTGISDLLLALDLIDATGKIFAGTLFATGCMLWVVSNIFADTFMDNRKLAKDLQKTNDTLHDLNLNLEKKVNERTADLAASRAEIKSILEHIPLGIMTLNKDKKINQEFSTFTKTLFPVADSIAGNRLESVFYPDSEKNQKVLLDVLDLTFDANMDWEMAQSVAPSELEYQIDEDQRHYQIEFNRIVKESAVESVMVMVSDITSQKRLEKKIMADKKAHDQEINIISSVINQDSNELKDFLEESERILIETEGLFGKLKANELDSESCNAIFRLTHSLKGNSRAHDLKDMGNVAHQIEDVLTGIRGSQIKLADVIEEDMIVCDFVETKLSELKQLLDKTVNIHKKITGEWSKDIGKGRKEERTIQVVEEEFDQVLSNLKLHIENNEPGKVVGDLHELYHQFYNFKLINLKSFYTRLEKIVQDVAKTRGKEIELVIQGDDIFLQRRAHNEVVNSLIHLVRNAVDHGVEWPDEREAKGKSQAGSLTVETKSNGENFTIEIRDDGKGLDPEHIKAKALEKKIIDENEAAQLDDMEAVRLILKPGFSSAEEVTDISGRGVGMDVVMSTMKELGGSLDIQSQVDQGTTFTLNLPKL